MLVSMRPGPRRKGRETGSTLAGILAIIAVTGIVAVSLLTTVAFGSGFTSAGRASVQARAAAEGGIDYALANADLCDPLDPTMASPADWPARFSVRFVEYRTDPGGAWTAGCPPLSAVAVRLQSTGWARTSGAMGHSRGDEWTMEAVAEPRFPYALFGETRLEIGNGHSTLKDSPAVPASVYTNGSFACTGKLAMHGFIYVKSQSAASFVANGECKQEDYVGRIFTTGGTNPQHPASAFPRLAVGDARWPKGPPDTNLASTTTPCTLSGRSVVLSRRPIDLTQGPCAGQLVTLKKAKIVLAGDVVIFADRLLVENLEVVSQDGRNHSLHLVKPLAGSTCTSSTVDVTAAGIGTDGNVTVMVYGGTGVHLRPPPSEPTYSGLPALKESVSSGQVYGCAVTTANNFAMSHAPVGRMRVASVRDLNG